MMNEIRGALSGAAFIFTLGFFAVFAAEKAASRWVRNTGYAAAAALWLSALFLLAPGLSPRSCPEAPPRHCAFLRNGRPVPGYKALPPGDGCPAVHPRDPAAYAPDDR